MAYKLLEKLFKSNLFIFGALFVIAFASFYSITFNEYPVKYDMIDCYLPWRSYVGECLQNGQLPWWNPFQDYGYPIHADPSSGSWYPVVWLIGATSGYSIYALGFELVLHVFLAGIGFWLLAKTMGYSRKIAFILAISYMLCGLFVSNAQHLTYVISACWLPYMLHYYLQLIKHNKLISVFQLALVSFMLLTGGYPAFTIILIYLLAILFVFQVVKLWKSKAWQQLKRFVALNLLTVFCAVLLASVFLFALIQVNPFLSRLGNFTLEQANFSPFSFPSFLSFLFPYATVVRDELFQSDLSMRNAYFGAIMFVLFLLGLFIKKKDQTLKILLFFGLFSLLAAVGDALPVRSFLYHYVPLMNVFRFPSVFRIFALIPFILIAGKSLEYYFSSNEQKLNKTLLIAFAAMIVCCLGIYLFESAQDDFMPLNTIYTEYLFMDSDELTISSLVAFQAILHLVLFSIVLIVIWKVTSSKLKFLVLSSLIVLDLFIAVQLNSACTVYYDIISAESAQENLDKQSPQFALNTNLTHHQIDSIPSYGQPFWKNLAIFQKEFSADGFNSFSFNNLEKLENENPNLNYQIKKNKLLLLSDKVKSLDELQALEKQNKIPDSVLFFENNSLNELKVNSFKTLKTDEVNLNAYSANSFDIQSHTQNTQLLTIFQKYYTGWKAYVNKELVPIHISDNNFMSIVLPSGANEISFQYENPSLKTAFYVSLFGLVLLLGLVAFLKFVRKSE